MFDSSRHCCVRSNILYDEKLVEDKEVRKEIRRDVSVKLASSFVKRSNIQRRQTEFPVHNTL